MKDIISQFDQIFRSKGGRLYFDSLEDGLRPYYTQYLEVFRALSESSPNARNIYVDFIDNDEFNAIASGRGRDEFVGIFLGTVLRTQIYINAFMSDPDVFTDIGILRTETRIPATVEMIRSGIVGFDAKSNRAPAPAQRPKDETRIVVANHMNMIACMFILIHELAHLTRGHLLYLRDELQMTDLNELPAVPISEHESHVRRLLEVDADRCAIQTGLARLPQITVLVPDLKSSDDLRIWGAAAAMIYLIMDSVSTAVPETKNRTHPSVWTRFAAIDYATGTSDAIPEGAGKRMAAGGTEVFTWWERNKLPSSFRAEASAGFQEIQALDGDYFTMLEKLEVYQEEREAYYQGS